MRKDQEMQSKTKGRKDAKITQMLKSVEKEFIIVIRNIAKELNKI